MCVFSLNGQMVKIKNDYHFNTVIINEVVHSQMEN